MATTIKDTRYMGRRTKNRRKKEENLEEEDKVEEMATRLEDTRYRPATYEDLTKDIVVRKDQFILCYKCYEKGFYEFNGGRYRYSNRNGERPTLEGAEEDSSIKVTI